MQNKAQESKLRSHLQSERIILLFTPKKTCEQCSYLNDLIRCSNLKTKYFFGTKTNWKISVIHIGVEPTKKRSATLFLYCLAFQLSELLSLFSAGMDCFMGFSVREWKRENWKSVRLTTNKMKDSIPSFYPFGFPLNFLFLSTTRTRTSEDDWRRIEIF